MKAAPFQAFTAYSWLATRIQSVESNFCETVYEVAQGIALAVDIVHQSELQRINGHEKGEGPASILGVQDTEAMLLLAKSSAKLLCRYAEERIDALPTEAKGKS